MIKVYLDDLRHAPDGWIRLIDAQSCLSILREGIVSELSLDHDLGEESPNGTWLVKQICADVRDGKYTLPLCRVHSQNPVGRRRMEEMIADLKEEMCY